MTILNARRGVLAFAVAAAMAAGPALAADKDPVAATVNGVDIHLSQISEFQHSLPPQMAQAPYPMLLDAFISNFLVTEAARKEGLQNDPEIKRAMKVAEDSVLRKGWMAKRLRAEVSDSVLKQRYDQFVAGFKPEDEIHARHVLTESEETANAVYNDVKNGASFADVAKAKSKDPSAQQNGGDLGYFTRSEMVPAFADVAFGLKPGEISKPVKTQFGWHVIKVEDRRLTSPPPYDEAKPVLRDRVAEETAQKLVGDIRAKAKVKKFNPDGSAMTDEPAKR
jgi:peptidyl-prolyl cis-trans isomerase C